MIMTTTVKNGALRCQRTPGVRGLRDPPVPTVPVDILSMSYQGPHVPFLDVMEDYDVVYDYLMKAAYPSGCSKNQRRVLRRRCIDHFKVSGGILYYSKTTSGTDNRDWRIVVKTDCHSSEPDI